MSGPLVAEFHLAMLDGLSGPTDKMTAALERFDAQIQRLNRTLNPFEEMTTPIARAERATEELNAALGQTASTARAATEGLEMMGMGAEGVGAAATATEGLNETLVGTAAAAREAASGLGAVGTQAEASVTRAMSAMDRIRGGMAWMRNGPIGTYASGVRGAVGRFGDSVQEGVGRGFGAAMTGFGLIAPIHAAAEYDNTLMHIGIGLDMHGAQNDAFRASFGDQMNALARATGQRSLDLVDAAGFFGREGYTGARLNTMMPVVAHIATAYNANPEASAKTAFALQHNLGISDNAIQGALASAALVGKIADLDFGQLAPLFPDLAVSAAGIGVHGRTGVDHLLAALAVSRKSAGSPHGAVDNERAFIDATFTNAGAMNFAKLGVDIRKLRKDAVARGLDPFEATLDAVDRVTRRGHDDAAMATLFHNVMDRTFATAIMAHITRDPVTGEPGYLDIKKRLSQADPSMVQKDFNTGINSTLIRLQAFEDVLAQLERRIGTGFVPIMNVMTKGLQGVERGFEWLDKHVPGVTTAIVGTVGGLLALATVLGVISAIAAPVGAAFLLIGSIFGATAAAAVAMGVGIAAAVVGVGLVLAGAGYVIYRNWTSIKASFISFGGWLSSWISGIGGAIGRFGTALGHMLMTAFQAPFAAVMHELHAVDDWFASSRVGQVVGRMVAPTAAPVGAVAAGGGGAQVHVHVSHDQGLTVRPVSAHGARVTTGPDRGHMVGRP
ncbi:phage tail tape measure protein [Gluconacetobacter sp.]|uniref:phage tail tape measure protein n=1 Tax=Gluconacetobacter sp. TaxID=1935994 RepID=UPI0039EC6DAE